MRKRIGDFLLDKGVVTPSQITQILKYSKETGLRFGEAGMEMGIISREKLLQVFGPNFAVDYFHIEPQYFPKITQELLPVDDMVRLGVVPLGFKTERKFFRTRKVLNIGQLDPGRKTATDEALRIASGKLGSGEIAGVKVFLVLAEQFLQILNQVYQTSDESLRIREHAQVDDTLSLFLEHRHD